MKIAVLGAGSWGTTLALVVARKGYDVMLWEFRPDAVEIMQSDLENKEFLPGYSFPPNLNVTADIHEAIEGASLCISVVPSHAMRSTMTRIADDFPRDCLMVSAAKGVEQETLMRMTEVAQDVMLDRISPNRLGCLSGPSHAEEVIKGLPTTVVIASENIEMAQTVQEVMSTDRFRVYAADDLIGVEIGGSLKNVVAIGTGITDGLGFGDNTKGALITRGLAEISRLGIKLGGRPATFAGLSGMGDLITTCCSVHSRNRYVGEQLGKGRSLQEILDEMVMVAEGVRTTQSTWQLAQREGIEMPITDQVHKVLFEGVDPVKATTDLMTRRLKIED